MAADDRLERARQLYEQAVFGGDTDALVIAEETLAAVEADLALARGRILHARFLADRIENPAELDLFTRAAELYRDLGDVRGEGEALFWVGTFHQVVRNDGASAGPAHRRSYELAARAGDQLTLSYAARHLGFAEMEAGRVDAARERFEESVQLRREIGFTAGVAAGLLALAELATQTGRDAEAKELLDEARSVALASGAHGILKWIDQPSGE
jgi:tetratricopeptide (TPR) repeat protein